MSNTLLVVALAIVVLGAFAWLSAKVAQVLQDERAQAEQPFSEGVPSEEDARREDALLEAFEHSFFEAVDNTVKLALLKGLREEGRIVLPSWWVNETIDDTGQLMELRRLVELRVAQRPAPSKSAS
jgi:hypothetical protein